MKTIAKIAASAVALISAFVSVSSCYDDSSLVERMDDLEIRMAALEKVVNTHAQQIAVLLSGDYITDVLVNGDGSYTIKFANHADITVKDGDKGETGAQGPQGPAGEQGSAGDKGESGADGKDGSTPVISVGQGPDGNWYWKVNGEWLLDADGKMVRANGIDGQDGEDGAPGSDGAPGEPGADGSDGKDGADGQDGNDGVTPKFKVENGYWYVSYDNGTTWEIVGPATGSGSGSGSDGADGKDGITPLLKIVDGYWYVSIDNGVTWNKEGKATGENGADGKDGDSFFRTIDVSNPGYVVFTLADGAQFQVPRFVSFQIGNLENAADEKVISVKAGETVVVPLILPSGLTEDSFSAIKAKIEYSGGSVVDVATRSGDGWALKVNAPTFTSGKCNGDASVSVTAPSEESGNLLLEVTLVFADGSVCNAAKVIRSVKKEEDEEDEEDEDPNAPVLSCEIMNVGPYTIDVVCRPGSKCQAYAATIISIGKESLYLSGSKIDYDKMKADVLDQFKLSLNPSQYSVQPYLVSTDAHTYTEADLYKNTVSTSSDCRGYESLCPGNGPFAVLLMTLDKEGNYDVQYQEVEVPKIRDSKNESLVATVSGVTSGRNYASATISAPGAAKVICYYAYSEADECPTFADDEKQAMPIIYDGPFTFTDDKLMPVSHYYLAVIPIDASGKIGEPVLVSVNTTDYEAKAYGRIVSASFAAQTEVDRLHLNMAVTNNASKVRVLATHPDAFLVSYSSVLAGLSNPYFGAYKEVDVEDASLVSMDLDVFKVGGVQASRWVVWGCIVDEAGEVSTPQNIATLADSSLDSWPLLTEIKVSFDSDGTVAPSFGQSSSAGKLALNFTTTGDVSRIRIFAETAFIYGVWYEGEDFESLLSDAQEYRDNWTEADVVSGAAEVVLDVKAGESYVLLACGIDASGKFTTPVNVAAYVAGVSNDATATYVRKSSASTMTYTIPYYYTVPQD